MQDVPFSVAAPTEEQLRERGVETIEDVAANVAGFTVQNLGPGQSQVAMRGVSAGQIVRDQPGVKEQVGVYLDESVISLSLFTPDLDLFDMTASRCCAGRRARCSAPARSSGTVRYITNQPELGESETVGEFERQHHQRRRAPAAAPRSASTRRSATRRPCASPATTRSYGGFIDAVQPDLSVKKDVNERLPGRRRAARFLLQAERQADASPRASSTRRSTWTAGTAIDVFNILANPFTTTRPAVTLGDRQQFTQFEEPFTDKFLLGDVNVAYNFGAADAHVDHLLHRPRRRWSSATPPR